MSALLANPEVPLRQQPSVSVTTGEADGSEFLSEPQLPGLTVVEPGHGCHPFKAPGGELPLPASSLILTLASLSYLLSHCPAAASWDHLPPKQLLPKSLSHNLLLRKPT